MSSRGRVATPAESPLRGVAHTHRERFGFVHHARTHHCSIVRGLALGRQANENEVDKYIDESKTKAQDLVSSYWTRAMVYAQHCFMHALQNLPQQQTKAAPHTD
jgi:hypothetical protein